MAQVPPATSMFETMKGTQRRSLFLQWLQVSHTQTAEIGFVNVKSPSPHCSLWLGAQYVYTPEERTECNGMSPTLANIGYQAQAQPLQQKAMSNAFNFPHVDILCTAKHCALLRMKPIGQQRTPKALMAAGNPARSTTNQNQQNNTPAKKRIVLKKHG